jgi:DNA-binding response OmpR family regulator
VSSVFITHRGTTQDFETSLYAGASAVMARPCSNAMLIARIVDLLHAAKASIQGDDGPDGDLALAPVGKTVREDSLVGHISGQFNAWWINVRIFFRSSSYARISALTFS